ncbi:Ig-like domain-containing protein [Actinoplanes campanulatus]|nr:Ig-like domain-containing protein [Actinoplanes capillaceus]
MLRTAVIAALSSYLIISLAGPAAAAADVTPPVVVSTGLTEGGSLGTETILRPVFSDENGVAGVDILVNGVFANSFIAPSGEWDPKTWEWSGRTRVGGVAGVGDGKDVDVTVRAWDPAGNVGSRTVRVRTDFQTPTASSITPDESVTLGAASVITPQGLPADTARVTLSYWFDSDAPVISTATAPPWALTWDKTGMERRAAVYVRVEDHAGNAFGYRREYQVDGVGPDVYASTNWIPEVIGPGEGHVAVSYYNPKDVARIEWWIDGALRSTTQVAKYDFGNVSRIADVEARVFDAVGNVTVVTRKVRVDATAPTVTAVTPAEGALVRGEKIWTQFKATDASGISGGQVYYGGGSAPFEAVRESPYRVSVPFWQGRNEVLWEIYDRLGNVTVVRRSFIVDNNAPYFTVIKAPKNGAKVKGTVKVAASVSEEYGIARVELLINGKVVAKDYAAAYKFSINTKKYGKKIKFRLRAYDKAGNVTTSPTRTWRR